MNVFDLWLPILLTGLATHIISMLAWMVLPHHKPEWKKLPVQDELRTWLDEKGVAPDQYIFPHMEDGGEEKPGNCTGTLILWDSPPNMGANVAKTLAFFFVVAFIIGYVASHVIPQGAAFMEVFRFVATIGLLTHCAGNFPGVFWFRRKVAMDVVDVVAHAIATGLIFAALWPGV